MITPELNAIAWRQSYEALDAALARATSATRLYLLVGPQGAGKSTWARASGVRQSESIIFDAILVQRFERAPILAAAGARSVPAVAVWFKTPLETCLARNAARPADEIVDEGGLRNVHAAIQPPTLAEGFERVIEVHPHDPLPRFGERVALRRLVGGDLRDFQAYRNDTEVGRYQSWNPGTDEQALAFLAEMNAAPLFRAGEWIQLGIACREDGALLGDLGLCVAPDSSEAEIGFTLARGAQGAGLGAEAVREAIGLLFGHTMVDRVVGHVDARNLPSIRLLERLGMQRVATVNAIFRGEPCLEHRYEAIRPSRS